jgi:recombinase-like zinc beta ribbon protein
LLKCGECGANYIITNATSYSCASFTNGGPAACDNNARFRRDAIAARLQAAEDELARHEAAAMRPQGTVEQLTSPAG